MRVEITFGGDAAGAEAASAMVVESLKKLFHQSDMTALSLKEVKITSSQASETAMNARRMQDSLSGVTREARQARREIDELKLTGRTGVGVGIFGSGFGRVGLMGALIGGGALVSGPAGAAGLAGLAALPGLATAGGAAIGVLTASFNGMGKALEGDKKAFDKLDPTAQQFTQTLRSLSPWLHEVQTTAQKGLFPGLDAGLHSALSPSNAAVFEQSTSIIAKSLGSVAQEWGKSFGSPEFTQGFSAVMKADAVDIRLLGDGALHFAGALGKVTVAGAPLTTWMSKEIDLGGRLIDNWVSQKQKSGELAQGLNSLKGELIIVGHFIGATTGVVFQLARALTPLGNEVLVVLTHEFQDLANWIDRNRTGIADFTTGALHGLEDVLGVVGPLTVHFADALIQVVHAIGGWEPAFAIVISGFLAKSIFGVVTSISGVAPAVAGAATATEIAATSMVVSWESVQGALVAVISEEAAVGAGAEAAAGKLSTLLSVARGLSVLAAPLAFLSIGTAPKVQPYVDPKSGRTVYKTASGFSLGGPRGGIVHIGSDTPLAKAAAAYYSQQTPSSGGDQYLPGSMSSSQIAALQAKTKSDAEWKKELAKIQNLFGSSAGGGTPFGIPPPFTSGLGGSGIGSRRQPRYGGTMQLPWQMLRPSGEFQYSPSEGSLISSRNASVSLGALLHTDPEQQAYTPAATVKAAQAHLADLRAKLGPEIKALQKELHSTFLDKDAVPAINAQMAQYKKTLTTGIEGVRTAVASEKTEFEQTFKGIGEGAIQALQDAASNWKSPARILLDQMQSDQQDASLQDSLAQAQQQLADAMVGTPDNNAIVQNIQAILGRYNLADNLDQVQSGILGGISTGVDSHQLLKELTNATNVANKPDPGAVANANKAVADAKYQITIAGLEKTATAEENAHADEVSEQEKQIKLLEGNWDLYFQGLKGHINEIPTVWAAALTAMGLGNIVPAALASVVDSTPMFLTPGFQAWAPGGPVQLHAAGGVAMSPIFTRDGRHGGGERGREAMLPLDDPRARKIIRDAIGSGGTDVHVHGNIPDDWIKVEVVPKVNTTIGRSADLRRREGRT